MEQPIDLAQVGMPAPTGWQTQQIQVRHPRTGEPTMLVKFILSTPTGINTFFFSGDEAQRIGASLRRAGKSAATGLWTPSTEAQDASTGIRDPFMPTGPTEASSGRTTDVSG